MIFRKAQTSSLPIKRKATPTHSSSLFRLSGFSASMPLLLALRNMSTRWVRTVLTTLGIVVGVSAMVAVSVTNASTLNSINLFFDEAAGQSDLLISSEGSGEFNEGYAQKVRRFAGVKAIAPAYVGVTILAEEAKDWEVQFGAGGMILPGTMFWLMGIDPELDPLVHNYQLVAGRLLQPGEEGYQVVLVNSYAADKQLELGEDLAVMTPSGMAELRIVGLIAKEGIGVANEGAIGFSPLPAVQELFQKSATINQLELVVEEGIAGNKDALEQLRTDLAEELGTEVEVKYPASRGQLVASSLQNYQLGLGFFGVVSLFVGSFLIYNAFAMTVVERTREIGMMRAVGTTRRQVIGLVLSEASILGVIGSLVGVVGGLLLARGLIVFMAKFTGQTIEMATANSSDLVKAVVVGVLVTLAAATVPAFQASHISPLQALRIKGTIDESQWLRIAWKFGPLTVLVSLLILYQIPFRKEVAYAIGTNSIFLLLLGATLCIPLVAELLEYLFRPIVLGIFGNEGKLGSSNVNRAKGRSTLTIAALMVGISMVVGVNGLTKSFQHDIESWVTTAIGGDLYVRSAIEMGIELEGRLRAVEGVAAVTRAQYVSTRVVVNGSEDETAIFAALDPETYLDVAGIQIEQGPSPEEAIEQLAQGQGLLVSAALADSLDLQLGEWLTLDTKRGLQKFRVIAIVVEFTGGDIPTVTGSWADLRRYFGVNSVDRYTVALEPGASLAQVSERVKNGVGKGQNLTVESQAEFRDKVLSVSSQAFALFDVLGLIGLVIAGLGVVNTMLMNVLERTRELGGLRSLGMTQQQVRRMILAEATMMGLVGAVFGVAFGVVLLGVFIAGLRQMGGFALQAQTPTEAMIAGFVIALVLAVGAAWYPAVRAGKVNIITAIKNE